MLCRISDLPHDGLGEESKEEPLQWTRFVTIDESHSTSPALTVFASTSGKSALSNSLAEESNATSMDAILELLACEEHDSRNVILEWVAANLDALSSTSGGHRVILEAIAVAEVSGQAAMAEQLSTRVCGGGVSSSLVS
jgi:hypothetical protein